MNSATITQSSGSAVEEIQVPGLCAVMLKHEVKSTSASFDWSGPVISPHEWARMMAFFEWTYATEKSEAQVRWYVHPEHGWKCWAMPQKGGTSMTTNEIPDHPWAAEQRKLFPSHEGWVYFMTVHHHCSAGAFQSGTDEADEKKVDGLHITIGKMDSPVRDIHVRMYLRGHRFEPRMNCFWQVDKDISEAAQKCLTLFGYDPLKELDLCARKEMALSFTALWLDWSQEKDGDKFPKEWGENYIVDQPTYSVHDGHRGSQYPGDTRRWCYHCQKMVDHYYANCPERAAGKPTNLPGWQREEGLGKTNGGASENSGNSFSMAGDRSCAAALREIITGLMVAGNDETLVDDMLDELFEDAEWEAKAAVIKELVDNRIEFAEMAEFYGRLKQHRERQEAEKEAAEEAEDKKREAQAAAQDGVKTLPWDYTLD